MFRLDGAGDFNIWEHSTHVHDLYLSRVRDEEPELTYQTQAVEILKPLLTNGDILLDAGCGAGQFYHPLRKRDLAEGYHGIDPTQAFIDMGRRELPVFGLAPERLQVGRIEHLAGSVDLSVCLNVLTNLADLYQPLERLLTISNRAVLIRESIKDGAERHYVHDRYLDSDVSLKVYVNSYDRTEITAFAREYGFSTRFIEDRRAGGQPEMVIDHPHYWTFVLFEKEES